MTNNPTINSLSPEKIKKSLGILGNNPDTIAETLEHLEIKGNAHSPWSCPLAMWLKEEFPEYKHAVSVNNDSACVGGIRVQLSDAQRIFVKKVDLYKFPKVIKNIVKKKMG